MKQILVIEDDRAMEPVIRTAIAAADPSLNVDWAETADEVLEKLDRDSEALESYALLVIDIQLPGKANGIDLWKAVRDQYPQMAFVMASGKSYEEFLKAAGPATRPPLYLRKPFNPAQLTAIVKRAIGA